MLRLVPVLADWSYVREPAGLELMVGFAERAGLSRRRALAGTGLSGRVDTPVTADQELRVVRNLLAGLGPVGAEVGRCYRAGTFGALGYLLLSSATVLDAMEAARRYLELSHAFALPSAEVTGDRVTVRLDGSDLPADVRRFLLERDATAVHQILESLVPGGVGATLSLGSASATIGFGTDQLTRPLPDRDATRHELAVDVCDAVVARRGPRTGLAREVQVLVAQRLVVGAPAPEVAARLGLSERTMRRRLAEEGTTYRALRDDVRRSLAGTLTALPRTMPVAELAARLGYSSSAAYAHARARW